MAIHANACVRRIWPHEFDALESHMLRLEPDDLRLRFAHAVNADVVRAYIGRVAGSRDIVLGLYVDGDLRGSGVLACTRDGWPGEGELAFAVEKRWRNAGVATELLRRLVLMARNRSIGVLRMICLPENQPMRHVARKAGMRLSFADGDIEARLDPPWPTPLSLAQELALEIGAMSLAAVDRAIAVAAGASALRGARLDVQREP